MSDMRLPRDLEFVRLLGAGGFGYVVLARDPNVSRYVAVKCVYGGAHAGDAVARMLREGQALAALKHPGILPVFEAANVGADVALITEYAEGGDLEQAVRSGGLSAETRLHILEQVAAALKVVHARGIVHRDLKPANIVLTKDLSPKIADFGLARLTADASTFRTDLGVVSGTPDYAAPEQFTDPDSEDERLDWYSFAVIAHRVLLDRLPGQEVPNDDPAAASAPIFKRALAHYPAERIAPEQLMTQLRALPLDIWPDVAVSQLDLDQDTAGGTAQSAPADAATSQSAVVPPAREPEQPADDGPANRPAAAMASTHPDNWVDVPVYQAPRAPVYRRLLPLIVGVTAGLVLAAVLLSDPLGSRGQGELPDVAHDVLRSGLTRAEETDLDLRP